MKTIAGATLIVAAAIFYHARTDLAGRKIGYDERMGMIKVCQVASSVSSVAGIILVGGGLLPARGKEKDDCHQKSGSLVGRQEAKNWGAEQGGGGQATTRSESA